MKSQNYKNHIHYYPPHHFLFYGSIMVLFGISISCFFKTDDTKLIWGMISILIAVITWLSFMLRQHYALGNQNRIARLELRFRYYTLTHKHFEEIEQQLSLPQVLALRFASNEELPNLIERTIKEDLSPDEIKKAVKIWLPDYMRV
jgi:hypothetical protein